MFKTLEGQRRYFAAYEKTLALWPVPIESFDVPTRYGSTHLHACGPKDAAPLVLLPGQAISSTMWYPNVGALSGAHRIYAIDIVGDMGKSVNTHGDVQSLDHAGWLADVFDELGLECAHVAGLSYGGYIGLKLAISAPERVNRLVLMAPTGLLPVPVRYFFRMVAVFLPIPFKYKQKLLGFGSPIGAPALKQMMTKTDFRYKIFVPPVFTVGELKRVQVPTLFLIGAHDVVYKSRDAMERAANLMPDVQAEIIPNAGHAVSFDQPGMVNRLVLSFLSAEAKRTA